MFLLVVPFVAMMAMGIWAGVNGRDPNNMTALFVTFGLAVAAASLVLFVFVVLPGTEGPNRYGPDPYGPDQLEEVFA